jgi:hypothetical protein
VVVLQARARQLAHLQAQLLADVDEVVHCPPGGADAAVVRVDGVAEFAGFEVTAALTLTGTTRRRPTAAQVAYVRARDRTCRAPGCRIPAHRTELDHTVAYADGGPTHTTNLGAMCTYHHRAKHEAGWRLRQITPGVFEWRNPLGHRYLVPPDE